MPDYSPELQKIIDQFFQNTLPRAQHHPTLGHIWIADHERIQTLTIEPLEGGQFEIAVRVPFPVGYLEKDKDNWRDQYMGYIASWDIDTLPFLRGRNTGGH